MGRRSGEEKRTYKTAATRNHGKPTLFARKNEGRIGEATEDIAGAEAGFKSKLGELPLFYVTSPKLTRSHQVSRSRKIAISPHRLAKGMSGSHGRRGVSADVHLGEGDAGWPPGSTHSQEIATWASSFRFELDAHDAERNLTDIRNLTETPGGSFRFRIGTEELSENLELHGSHLKLRQSLENNHDSNRRAGIVATANATGSERQDGYVDAELQLSDCWDVVPFEARRNVAVDVPNSPERDELLRRLNKLKATHSSASPSLLKFGLDDVTSPSLLRIGSPNLDDVVSYHKEMAKLAARRDHLHQRLKNDSRKSSCPSPLSKSSCASPLSKSSSTSTPIVSKNMVQKKSQETVSTLGELEIMPRVQSNLPSSGLRGSLHGTVPESSVQELLPITPTPARFKQSPRRRSSSSSIQDQIVSIHKLQFPARAVSSASHIPSPDHTPFLSAARGKIPFKWEEEPGKPKITVNDADARRLSREEIEVSNCVETILQLDSSQNGDTNIVPESATVIEASENGETSSARRSADGAGDEGRIESHRYYGKGHLRGHSESSLGQSSRRYSTHERLEAQIDLDTSAAARFLVELYDTPSSTPGRHCSSPMFAVPFKWEDAPGKAKVETSVGGSNMLQLPPRLAVPSDHSAESFSRDLRASHPFAGFLPCLTASSPGQQQRKHSDRMLVQFGSSKSLPPRAPSPSERRKRHGLVGRCYSTPQEGCQIRVSKSTASSPVPQAVSRNLFSEETENSPSSWLKKDSSNPNAPSSPRSILCGPDEGSGSQTSASNVFSSGDLEDFTQQTNDSGQSASKSSNSSFESMEEDFAELPSPASSNLHPLHSGEPSAPPKETSSLRPEEPLNAMDESPLNLSKMEKQKSQKQCQDTTHSPEPAAPSPALTNYFQNLEQATSTLSSTSAGAATASGYLNSCEGELPLAPKPALPTIQSMLLQQQPKEINSSAQASPKRPTRLPYTMPSVADQFLASCDNFTRRQVIHDLSPRLPRQYSGRRLDRSSHGHTMGGTTPTPRVERYQSDEVCRTSPAYAAALQLFSPPTTQRQRKGLAKPLATRPRRRARFMVSRIC